MARSLELKSHLKKLHKDHQLPRIGDHSFEKALLDLGEGVNLLPYTVYEKLGLGELQLTSITLQLADRTIKRPRGILEDVLVKEAKFDWTKECMTAFNTLKLLLTSTPIMRAPDWSLPFELMCDASDFAVGAVLGQRIKKLL
ncbi:uncharacterized protein LOC132165063 [Corylus avellana]|uniref:uncharacterized protein LOC132165063 n=1 Tax=Corylus avellana TaxID=13451 RepID=UPI00286A6E1A|nr:uncharacterized protein LOC132165063 [Corylus avellana]